jgi:polyhydroxyalkanoate synthase subunit PhaC
MNPLEKIVDPFGAASSFRKVCDAWLQNSEELKQKVADLMSRLEDLNLEVLRHQLPQGSGSSSSIQPEEDDDDENHFMGHIRNHASLTRRYYAVFSSWLRDFVDTVPGLREDERRRARFWSSQYLNAIAPSNFFWTNPGAVQRFIDTDGSSVLQGFMNWIDDGFRGDSLLTIVDHRAFKPGKNIATTEGRVVYRNGLLEVIQYSPVTEKTYAIPIVLIQPWINKFYIFDLTAQNSVVHYLRSQGFNVFITSWKNPTADMRATTFTDYMLKGALQAALVAGEICKAPRVHAAGYCIGGTVLAALMAWLNRMWKESGPVPVADWSLFSTLTDFSEPGDIGVFVSEEAIEAIESLMKTDGYLDSQYISQTFRLLRSDSLVWRNYVHNYLYGGTPPKSDMLFWNDDGTRMPEAMCSFYLRDLYLHNKLVKKDAVVLGDCPIDLGCIEQPLYAVGAQQDHISPWRSTFRTCSLVGGPVRYVLASEGHIAGIVNPPSEISRRKYWAGDVERDGDLGPDAWQSAQPEKRGSWWTDWCEWLLSRDDAMTRPPSLGSKTYPPLEKAPGLYVNET